MNATTMEVSTVVIKVLGANCVNCKRLEAMVHEVVGELGVDAKVEHVSDYPSIAAYGVMMTPGLVIDEKVVMSGRVPSKADLTSWITTALAKE